jgi:hypothetical protein
MDMRFSFKMEGYRIRPGFGKFTDKAVRLNNHQVYIKENTCPFTQGADKLGTKS